MEQCSNIKELKTMRVLYKTFLAATVSSLAFSANAANIDFEAFYGGDAVGGEASFYSKTKNHVFENFEDTQALDSAPNKDSTPVTGGSSDTDYILSQQTFETKVGAFTLPDGQGDNSSNTLYQNLMIESQHTGEFGRDGSYAGTDAFSGQWLDSNDAFKVTWDLLYGDFNAFGFYITDANDQGAKLVLNFEENQQSVVDLTFAGSGNSNLAYISLFSDTVFSSAQLIFDNNTTRSDGWGIDNVTLAKVSEPGTLALMGLGIVGLLLARRRKV
jgi:PEP-CTERM motif-containing protein